MEEDSVCFKMSWKGGYNSHNKIKGRLYIFCFPVKLKGGKKKKRNEAERQMRGKYGSKSHELCAVHRKTDFKQTQIQIYFII